MQIYNQCIPCFIQQAYDALQQVDSDEALTHRTLQRVLQEAARFPTTRTPPEMAQITHRIIREETGRADPYEKIKRRSTEFALRIMDEARAIINGSIDPFKMALRFSIAGNILDFALTTKWTQLDLANFIENTRVQPLNDAAVEQLRKAVRRAGSILFLGDNAGETVFDRLLIEQFPNTDVFYAVKGSPVINDATLADARAAGLHEVAELTENGSDAPGTILEDCNAPFRWLFNEAGLVIAKGQANYESLSQAKRPLFFLTQVKCPVIGRDLGEPVGGWVVREHKGTEQ
ncbi:damage-control phosphatase ARMT1 family protein [Pontiella sulfatireligans]|uniref:Damage-control phosphatase ARMT1-like metal-binding domain-containing protein n=1 Tax=Pontiella sulfatireligans TaxID=2750658 RepID=A0A6C2UT10_9BACT|nr:ARMT1-like domain-containing protein [Pontiella sulfatireligans]VGO22384.1 hypothetical protein SCARR_04467 [Pontiella sulfatireligans]